ncbi:hypothetical protein ACFLIM_19585 [Nonomuraea sp. M3C6]|uniref:Uncharacterized protein n=1 Tax=Nonomuraea marmarensis TaxID=3351344 RepID=A0ABW7AGG5_9ACTN
MIDQLEHSPAETRRYADYLLGRQGVVVELLRLGSIALVKLDGDLYDLPLGCRRWAVHWDDLDILEHKANDAEKVEISYRVGLLTVGHRTVQHAVGLDQHTIERDQHAFALDEYAIQVGPRRALCGQQVHPLPVCGWSLRFTPTATGACGTCVELTLKP